MSLTPGENRKFYATWRDAVRQFGQADMTKAEIEEERQALLKMAGAKPDQEGRYSTTRLTSSQLNTVLDLIETTILGKPNQKRRSSTMVYRIKQIGIADEYINAITRERFRCEDWKTLPESDLVKLFYAIKERARAKNRTKTTA